MVTHLLVHLSITFISEFLNTTCNFSQDPRPRNYQSGWVQPRSQGVCCVFLGSLRLLFFGFKHFSDRAKILQSNKDNLPVWTRWWLAVLSHFKVFVLWSYASGWTNLERPFLFKSGEPLLKKSNGFLTAAWLLPANSKLPILVLYLQHVSIQIYRL